VATSIVPPSTTMVELQRMRPTSGSKSSTDVSAFRRAGARMRPIVQRRGWDLVRYPGASHLGHLRNSFLRRMSVDLVVDVGANTGQFGRRIRSAGYRGDMVSLEPMAEAFKELERRVDGDPAWTAIRGALGSEPGELPINISKNSISSSLLPMEDRHADAALDSVYVGTEMVPVHRLDELLAHEVTTASAPYLKIDTQGYEATVLNGASGVLDRFVGVELELSLAPLYSGQILMLDLMNRMRAEGFEVEVVTPGLFDPRRGETLQVDGIFARHD
jgi:FkbM family methyltransferase